MIAVLLTFLVVIPTLFSVPYIPYIIATLTIGYLVTRVIKGRNLRSSRKLVEKKGRENKEIEVKKEYETNFIESTTDIISYICLSFLVSIFILYLVGSLSPLLGRVLLLTIVFCLLAVIYMNHTSPFHEDKRKWETHYKNFCKGYMDERYQEFLREERERKREK